jgi:hypothetical protein
LIRFRTKAYQCGTSDRDARIALFSVADKGPDGPRKIPSTLDGVELGRDREIINQAGGSSRLAWNWAKYLANIASVSITSVKPACISMMVETIAGGPGSLRP